MYSCLFDMCDRYEENNVDKDGNSERLKRTTYIAVLNECLNKYNVFDEQLRNHYYFTRDGIAKLVKGLNESLRDKINITDNLFTFVSEVNYCIHNGYALRLHSNNRKPYWEFYPDNFFEYINNNINKINSIDLYYLSHPLYIQEDEHKLIRDIINSIPEFLTSNQIYDMFKADWINKVGGKETFKYVYNQSFKRYLTEIHNVVFALPMLIYIYNDINELIDDGNDNNNYNDSDTANDNKDDSSNEDFSNENNSETANDNSEADDNNTNNNADNNDVDNIDDNNADDNNAICFDTTKKHKFVKLPYEVIFEDIYKNKIDIKSILDESINTNAKKTQYFLHHLDINNCYPFNTWTKDGLTVSVKYNLSEYVLYLANNVGNDVGVKFVLTNYADVFNYLTFSNMSHALKTLILTRKFEPVGVNDYLVVSIEMYRAIQQMKDINELRNIVKCSFNPAYKDNFNYYISINDSNGVSNFSNIKEITEFKYTTAKIYHRQRISRFFDYIIYDKINNPYHVNNNVFLQVWYTIFGYDKYPVYNSKRINKHGKSSRTIIELLNDENLKHLKRKIINYSIFNGFIACEHLRFLDSKSLKDLIYREDKKEIEHRVKTLENQLIILDGLIHWFCLKVNNIDNIIDLLNYRVGLDLSLIHI